MKITTAKKLFFALLVLALLSVFGLFRDLAYPFITSKVLWFRSAVLLALPIYFYLLSLEKSIRPNLKHPLHWVVLAFFAINVISSVWGVNFHRSVWGNYERMGGVWYLGHLTLLYFYLDALAKYSNFKFQQILKLLALLGALGGLYAVLTKLGFPAWPFPDDSLPARASGFFGNPIFFASFLIFPFTLSLFFLKQAEDKKAFRFWLLASVFNFLGIYLSATRGALLGLLVGLGLGLLVWALMIEEKKYKLYGLLAIAGSLLVVLMLFVFSGAFAPGSVVRRLTDFGDSNTRARILQWEAGLKGFKDHPVLGVGPENYYVIGNKYFNPNIYQYDRSWFDKPHNYPLEVLLTSGLLGFLAYVILIGLSVGGAYRALKHQILSRLEFAILLGGITAYQVQNLFVFDTVSASMAFYVFLAFTAFLWQADRGENKSGEVKASSEMATYGLILCGLVVVWVWYITNFLPAQAMAKLNTGVSIGLRNPVEAREGFKNAYRADMNLDLTETASKYEEFASELAIVNQKPEDRAFVLETVKDVIAVLESALKQNSNDPILWFKLTNMKSTLKHITQVEYSKEIEEVALKSVSLAPNRVEPRYYLVQALQVKRDLDQAVRAQIEVIKIDYANPFNFWRMALLYRDFGDLPRAYNLARFARQNGYEFRNLAEAQWMAKYYSDLNQFNELQKAYEELIKNNLADFQTYANLATVYAKLGDKDKARATALKVLELEPKAKADVDLFLQKLNLGEQF
jgi:O-antigen ligase/tetratricopeptide (TPR) repeat protein